MSNSHTDILIIGTGMAGVGVARALRRLDSNQRLTMITADSGDEYSKPLLSTGFAKRLPPEQLAKQDAQGLADALDAEVLSGWQVTRVNPAADGVEIRCGDDRRQLGYRHLVLATGAAPRLPFTLPAAVEAECHVVNDLDDYRRFHAALSQVAQRSGRARVGIVGAGLVGCEFANDLKAGGHEVVLVAPDARPLARFLPDPLGQALADAFTGAGIELALNRQVSTFEPRLAGRGGVCLCLDDGSRHEVDLVLLATGLSPRSELAKEAGLAVGRSGIEVDRYLTTSVPNIHALGDVACVDGVSAMYVQPLQACAKALASTLLEAPTQVHLGAWPVIVKTPLLPVVAYPPAHQAPRWEIQGHGQDLVALASDGEGRFTGFALTGRAVRRKVELSRAAPALLG